MAQPEWWNRRIPFTPSMDAIGRVLRAAVVVFTFALIGAFGVLGCLQGWFVPLSSRLGIGVWGSVLAAAYCAVLLWANWFLHCKEHGLASVMSSGPIFALFLLFPLTTELSHAGGERRVHVWADLIIGCVGVMMIVVELVLIRLRCRAPGKERP